MYTSLFESEKRKAIRKNDKIRYRLANEAIAMEIEAIKKARANGSLLCEEVAQLRKGARINRRFIEALSDFNFDNINYGHIGFNEEAYEDERVLRKFSKIAR